MFQKIMDVITSVEFRSEAISILIRIGILIVLIYFSEHYFRSVVRKITGKFLDKKKSETIENVSVEILHSVIAFLLIFIILGIFGVSEAALTAISGGVTLAIGFGARNFIADIFAGITILVEQSFEVGDTIDLAGQRGKVDEIGVRTTSMINGITGEKIIIPNRDIKTITNYSVQKRKAVIEIPLARNEKFEDAYAILEEGCKDFSFEGLEEIPVVNGIISYTTSGYLVRITAQVQADSIWSGERAMRKYFLELLKEKNVIVPVSTEDMKIES